MRYDGPYWSRGEAHAAMQTMHWQPTLNLRLHGLTASILWGYRTAAALSSWRIWKKDGKWQLAGTVTRAEGFMCRQRGLLFTAPRDKGRWAWGVDTIEIKGTSLRGVLGEPEQ